MPISVIVAVLGVLVVAVRHCEVYGSFMILCLRKRYGQYVGIKSHVFRCCHLFEIGLELF